MSSYRYNLISDWLDSRRHMSPEGALLARLDEAAERVTTESDITDELRCHLRRIGKEIRA